MHRLHRLNPRALGLGGALPDVLQLARHGIEIRRGEVCMIAAQPNDGKSFISLWLAIQWAKLGVRSLYFSADTNERTTIRRAAACLTGHEQSYIENQIENGWNGIRDALAVLSGGVVFSFETDPTYQDLYEETVAFWESWGEYPSVIYVDNLMDIVTDNENEYGGMRDVSKALKRLARITGAAVIVLHHCNEQERRADHPPARREITGKVSQKAELILTLQLADELGEMRVAAVKNRNGLKDPTGIRHVKLRVDLDRVQFYTYTHEKLGALSMAIATPKYGKTPITGITLELDRYEAQTVLDSLYRDEWKSFIQNPVTKALEKALKGQPTNVASPANAVKF